MQNGPRLTQTSLRNKHTPQPLAVALASVPEEEQRRDRYGEFLFGCFIVYMYEDVWVLVWSFVQSFTHLLSEAYMTCFKRYAVP